MHTPQGPGGHGQPGYGQPTGYGHPIGYSQAPPAAGPPYPHPGAVPPNSGGGVRSAASKKREKRAEKKETSPVWELFLDKSIDFALIFVGLYAATALQRCQDTAKEKDEYVALLNDFKRELRANIEQEASIEKDLGAIDDTEPGTNLGPMQVTFRQFFEELSEDEKVVKCLHEEYAVRGKTKPPPGCHELYAKFDQAHRTHEASFDFKPAVLTPFYRKEVWQLYLADGVKTFRNKELAVDIAEVYANAMLVEEQVEDIEHTYNEAFMKQVGRTAATDMELAEVVHDEEKEHSLSQTGLTLLIHVDEAIKDEHYAALEVQRILELKVERMKKTVQVMREEIEAVQQAIDHEIERSGAEARDSEPSAS